MEVLWTPLNNIVALDVKIEDRNPAGLVLLLGHELFEVFEIGVSNTQLFYEPVIGRLR